MDQSKTLGGNRTDKAPTHKEKERAEKERQAAKDIMSRANPKIDGNVIKGYN